MLNDDCAAHGQHPWECNWYGSELWASVRREETSKRGHKEGGVQSCRTRRGGMWGEAGVHCNCIVHGCGVRVVVRIHACKLKAVWAACDYTFNTRSYVALS